MKKMFLLMLLVFLLASLLPAPWIWNKYTGRPDYYEAGGGPHAILGALHSDTLPAAVQRGDLIVGNSTPAWARRAIGAAGTYLRSDGLDSVYSSLLIGDLPIVTPAKGGTGLDTSGSTGVPSINAGAWSVGATLANSLGGTGQDSSAWTGVPSTNAGVWSVAATLANTLGGTGQNSSGWTGTPQTAAGVWSSVAVTITDVAANSFRITKGTSDLDVTTDVTLNQDVSSTSSPGFSNVYAPNVYGSTGASGSLNLYSTSHATKGYITAQDFWTLSSTARNLKTWWWYEEFMNSATPAGIFNAVTNGTGASSTTQATPNNTRPGIWRLSTGTTASGYGVLRAGQESLMFSAGTYLFETELNVTTLSDGTNTFVVKFGFLNNVTGVETDGAYFYYSDSGASPNWMAYTENNSVTTVTDTGVAVAAGSWVKFLISVNADATLVTFYINGVLKATHNTNIPGNGRRCGPVFTIIKTLGTTARTMDLDWAWVHVNLTASR